MKYHVNSTGPSKEGFIKGLQQALKTATENGTKEVALAIHGKQNLTGIIQDVLGTDFVKTMNKHGFVMTNGLTLYLLTERISSGFKHGVILACHSSESFLSKLMNDHRATDTVYVPWAPEEFESYLEKHESTEIAL